MYLHGSLAVGDFNPYSSDIDFVVVTKDAISKNLFIALEKMHNRIAAGGREWVQKLEGSYIPR